MAKKTRKVRIVTEGGAHYVKYVDRVRFGRYLAACFDARQYGIETVHAWLAKHPELVVVD